jgi:hypothetical protein
LEYTKKGRGGGKQKFETAGINFFGSVAGYRRKNQTKNTKTSRFLATIRGYTYRHTDG